MTKTGQDQHLTLSPQGYILFWSLFLTRNIVSPPGKYPWHELFKSLQALIFLGSPHFSKIRTEDCPPSRKRGGGGAWYCDDPNIDLSNFKRGSYGYIRKKIMDPNIPASTHFLTIWNNPKYAFYFVMNGFISLKFIHRLKTQYCPIKNKQAKSTKYLSPF